MTASVWLIHESWLRGGSNLHHRVHRIKRPHAPDGNSAELRPTCRDPAQSALFLRLARRESELPRCSGPGSPEGASKCAVPWLLAPKGASSRFRISRLSSNAEVKASKVVANGRLRNHSSGSEWEYLGDYGSSRETSQQFVFWEMRALGSISSDRNGKLAMFIEASRPTVRRWYRQVRGKSPPRNVPIRDRPAISAAVLEVHRLSDTEARAPGSG